MRVYARDLGDPASPISHVSLITWTPHYRGNGLTAADFDAIVRHDDTRDDCALFGCRMEQRGSDVRLSLPTHELDDAAFRAVYREARRFWRQSEGGPRS